MRQQSRSVRYLRYHKKVWLWWGKWWAIQLYRAPYISLGVHIDLRRPLVDLHIGWLIVSFGRDPVRTAKADYRRSTNRGFLQYNEPIL